MRGLMSEQTISTPDTIRVELVSTKAKNSKTYVIDLRVNSPGALSYFDFGGLNTAPAMVRLAKAKGLDVIAITDFYSATYVDKAKLAAKESELTVLPGVMIRAQILDCNEVMLCCIFPENYTSGKISEFLQALEVPASAAFNREYIVKTDLHEIMKIAAEFNAIVFPSRMDKTPHRKAAIKSLISDYGFTAFDLAHYEESVRWFKHVWPDQEFALLSFSNANVLAQVGNRSTVVSMSTPGYSGLKALITG